MLQVLRKKSASIVAKGFFGLLVLSFAVWGIGDIFRASPESEVAAAVGPIDIPVQTLAREYQRSIQTLERQLGVQIDPVQARQFGIVDQALERLIAQALLDVKAHEMGIMISDDLISQSIRTDPAFQNQFGQFDPAVFRNVLFNTGFTEPLFVQLMRNDMARRQLISSVTMIDRVPRSLADRIFEYRNESRVAETLFIRTSEQSVEAPNDVELREYYRENEDRFMSPEYRAVTAIVLEPETLMDEIFISEDELRAAYEDRLSDYKTPERRQVAQIVFDDEAKAREAETMLNEGRDYEAVAEEVGGGAPLDLGNVTIDEIGLPTLAEAAFALDEVGVSAPVQSPLGWHIIRVAAISPGSVQPFEEVRNALRDSIARDEASDGLYELANQVEDALGGGSTLEEAAQSLGLDPLRIAAVDRSGLTPDGTPAAGVPASSEFLQIAFNSDAGVDSFLTETTEGFFILRVDSIKEMAPRPFETVRDSVAATLTTEQQDKAAEEYAESILELARSGWSLADLAREQDLRPATSSPVTRAQQDPAAGVSAEVTQSLFEIAADEPAMAPARGGYTIFRLKEINAADAGSDNGAEAERLQELTAGAMRIDLLEQLDRAIRQHHEVTINRPVIDNYL